MFLKRQFDAEDDIYYLSPEPTQTKGADGQTSLGTLELAITNWAKIMWANLPFRRLIFAFFLYSTATAISGSTFIFFIRGVLADEKAGIALLLSYYFVNYYV